MARTKLKKNHTFTTSRSRVHAACNKKVIRSNGISRRSARLHQENCDEYMCGEVKEIGITIRDYKLCLDDHTLNCYDDNLNLDKMSKPLEWLRRRLPEYYDEDEEIVSSEED